MSELGPDARSIVEAARAGERPTDADRARMRRTLMRAIAAGGAAAAATSVGAGAAANTAAAKGAGAAAAATIAASGTASVAGKVIAILAIAGGVSAGVASLAAREGAPVETRAPAMTAPISAPLGPSIPPPPRELRAGPGDPSAEQDTAPDQEAELPAPSRAPSSAGPRAQPRASSTSASAAPGAPEDPLDVETRGLGEAHAALQAGDAERALSLLEQQSAAHAQGELRQERAAARVVALCKLGRAEARAAAESFLRENPRSPLTDRVRAACPPSSIR